MDSKDKASGAIPAPPVSLREWTIVAVVFVGVSILCAWPLSVQFHTEPVVGGDSWQNTWNLWWTSTAVENPGYSLFFTPLLFHPHGLSLSLHSLSHFNTFLSLPFQTFFSLETIHHFLLWIYFPLTALAAYALLRRWITCSFAAFWGAWIFTFSPFRMGRFIIEQIDIVAVAFIPLFILGFILFLEKPKIRTAFAAAFILLMQFLSAWYTGAYCQVFAAFAVLFYWFTDRLPWKNKNFWIGMAIIAILPGILLLPLILNMFEDLQDPLFDKHVDQIEVSRHCSGDLLGFLTPGVMYPTTLLQTFHWHVMPESLADAVTGRILAGRGSNVLEANTYIGWVNFFIVLVTVYGYRKGWWDKAKKRILFFWLVEIAFFSIMTLGPTLQIARFDTGMPLPYLLLNWLPGYNVMRAPNRLVMLALLGIGLCVGFLLEKLVQTGRWKLAYLLAFLIFIDFAMFPVNRLFDGRPAPPVYKEIIAKDPAPGAVLQIPSDDPTISMWYNVQSMYFQTLHERPLLIGYMSRTPYDLFEIPYSHPLIRAMAYETLLYDTPEEVWRKENLRQLKKFDVRYVVLQLHEMLVYSKDPERVENVRRRVDRLLGPPIQEDAQTVTYRVDYDDLPGNPLLQPLQPGEIKSATQSP